MDEWRAETDRAAESVWPAADGTPPGTYHDHGQRHGHRVTGQVRNRVRFQRVHNGLVVTEKAALERLHHSEEDQKRNAHCNGGRAAVG